MINLPEKIQQYTDEVISYIDKKTDYKESQFDQDKFMDIIVSRLVGSNDIDPVALFLSYEKQLIKKL